MDIAAHRGAAKLLLEVTAVSGTTPSLSVFVDTSPSGNTWQQIGLFTATTAAGFKRLTVSGCERYVRVRWTIAGTDTPTFTFSVTGEAHQIFCQLEDVSALGAVSDAITDLSPDTKARGLIAGSDIVANYLQAGGDMPKLTWGDELRRAAAIISAYDLICGRGFDPNEYDSNFRTRYEDVIKWLEKIAAGELEPTEPPDEEDPDTGSGGAFIVTTAKRGW